MSVTSTKLIAPPQITTEPVYYRCNGYYGWVPVGTIAGRTGGWPYFGSYSRQTGEAPPTLRRFWEAVASQLCTFLLVPGTALMAFGRFVL
jgi:hypothetical protein